MKLALSRLEAEYLFESFKTKRVRVSGLNCLTEVTKKNACFPAKILSRRVKKHCGLAFTTSL